MDRLPDGTLRGTPQELNEYQRLQAEKAAFKPIPGDVRYPYWPQEPWKVVKSPSVVDDGSILGIPKITSGDPPGSIGSGSTSVKRCDHPCYCTGACEGRSYSTLAQSYANTWGGTHP